MAISPLDTSPPNTFSDFLYKQEEIRKKVIESENRFVRVVIDLFPDVTTILELPFIGLIPIVKRVSKNIKPISICIIVSSVALSCLSVIGIICSSGIVKLTCTVVFFNSQGVASLFTMSFIKKYFILERNHRRIEIINHMVSGMFDGLSQMQKELDRQQTNNSEQALTINKLKVQVELITQAVTKLQNAPENLEKVASEVSALKGKIPALQKQVDDLKEVIENLKQQEKIAREATEKLSSAQEDFLALLKNSLSPSPPKKTKGKENTHPILTQV